ncbi:MAG: DUF1937 family protein [Pirellulaceae bacterium]|nr:DUF1937 family protein [Pirellulaceae bacterium]
MIYLASPYSHTDPLVREDRFNAACMATAALMQAGCSVYSPIVHSHPLVQYGLPIEWQYWQAHDCEHLQHCNQLLVLTLDGWRTSRGVQAEIDLAIDMDLPVHCVSPAMISNSSGGETSINARPLSQETSI